MTRKEAQVVVAGHICLDIIPTLSAVKGDLASLLSPGKLVNVGRAVTSTGGAVSNTGRALHRLGFHTRLMGKVGDELLGWTVLEALRREGPSLADDMVVAPGQSSSYTIVVNPPGVDRSFLHYPGANDTFTSRDVDCEGLGRARLFHFGYPPIMRSMYLKGGRECVRLLRRVKRLGITTSLDMTMPDADSESGTVDWEAFLANVLPWVDVFLPSVDEMLFMLDRRRAVRRPAFHAGRLTELSGRLLAMGAAVVGLKLGEEGLYLRTTSDASRLSSMGRCVPERCDAWRGREILAPCFRVRVVGTTGAGDCAIAGFLGALLKGLSPEGAVTAAVAAGAFNVERADATSGVPHWSTLQRRIRSGWKRRPAGLKLPGWTWDARSSVWVGPKDEGRR